MRKIAAAAILLVTLSACEDSRINRPLIVGAALGAVAGGFIGVQFDAGIGAENAFAAAGALGGAAVGAAAVKLFESDILALQDAATRTVAEASDGQVVDWQNPDTGREGIVRPSERYEIADGTVCRDFRAAIVFDAIVRSGGGTACQQADGMWRVVGSDFGV